jgi:hypothetical protein
MEREGEEGGGSRAQPAEDLEIGDSQQKLAIRGLCDNEL